MIENQETNERVKKARARLSDLGWQVLMSQQAGLRYVFGGVEHPKETYDEALGVAYRAIEEEERGSTTTL